MPGRRSISDFFAFGTESLPSKWSAAETRRQHFPQSGLLIDRLVEFAGLQLSYPPRNISDLQHWLSELSQADLDLSDLQKHAFRLYLLCDFNPESADAYALNFFLPRNYLFAIKGYWALDQGEHPLAVSALARPGVDVDPPLLPTIVYVLGNEDPLQLVRLTQLARSKLAQHLYPDDFSHIVRALAETGQVSESLRLLRFAVEQQPENVRDEELKTQLLTVLTAALGLNVSGRPVPESLRQLLHQPLSMQEDVLLCSAALSPLSEQLDPLANDLLLDLVLNRLVAQGRHLEALRLLNATAIKPATTEAARRRALLSKSIKNVLTEVDLSVLSLDVPNESSQSDSLSAGGHADVDMGQHPWASTEEPHPAPAAKSLAEAQRNANLRTQALKDTAVQEQKNAPLSASPTLRKPHTGMDGSSTLAHHPLEAFKLAAMSRSPSHFQLTRSPSVSRAASPAAASPHRSRASGSPFVHKPTLALRRESARASPSISRHIPQIADISTGSAGADQSIDTVTHSPIVHRTRSRGNKTRLNIKTPKKTVLEHSQKRSAPHPQEDAGPPKVQALDPESEAEAEAEDNDAPTASTPKGSAVRGRRKQARLQIEPTDMATMMRKRNQLPGHFDMDLGEQSDDDTLSRRTATDDEDEDEDDFAEPWSALTQSSSIRKPRHIRANAPEPPTPANPLPTPRRSARLSQSVSRETSVDSLASSTSSLPRQSLKKGNAKGRAKPPRAPRREESLVEEDEEMTA